MNSVRRRGFFSLLVDPYKQVKLGLIFLLLNAFFAVVIGAVFAYFLWDIYDAVSEYFKMSGSDTTETMQKFLTPLLVAAGCLSVFIVVTLAASIKYTHQIYGPLVSVHRFLDELLAGQRPQRLVLRPSDQLQDLADKLNRVSDQMHLSANAERSD